MAFPNRTNKTRPFDVKANLPAKRKQGPDVVDDIAGFLVNMLRWLNG